MTMSWFKERLVPDFCYIPGEYRTPTLSSSDEYSPFEIIHFRDLPTGSFRLLKHFGKSESESLLLKLQDKEGAIHIVWATSFLTSCINKRKYTSFITKHGEDVFCSKIPDWVFEEYRIYAVDEKRNVTFQDYIKLKGIKGADEKGSISFFLC